MILLFNLPLIIVSYFSIGQRQNHPTAASDFAKCRKYINNPAPLVGSSLTTCHVAVRDVALQHAHALGRIPQVQISKLMSFTAARLLSVDSPSLPFCGRFNEPLRRRRQHYGFTASYRLAATLDTKPLAKSDSDGNRTRLSANHFQSARIWLC